ncbi:hypothetical protein [Streptomyces sp. NPDC016845]
MFAPHPTVKTAAAGRIHAAHGALVDVFTDVFTDVSAAAGASAPEENAP